MQDRKAKATTIQTTKHDQLQVLATEIWKTKLKQKPKLKWKMKASKRNVFSPERWNCYGNNYVGWNGTGMAELPLRLGTEGFWAGMKDWKHMSTLAEIQSLEVLKLKENAFTGTSWNAAASVFKNLQVLVIIDVDIVLWVVSTDSFPSLSCVVLKNCDKLEYIPAELGKKLEFMEIERIRRSAVESAEWIQVVKRAEEEERRSKGQVQFKLQIGPGCGRGPN